MIFTDCANPAEEYQSERLDFNKALRPFPACEFEFRYHGHDMEECHIQDGDLLIVNRMCKARDGAFAIVLNEGTFICRQIFYSKKWGCYVFLNKNKWLRVEQIYGIVTFNIHSFSSYI